MNNEFDIDTYNSLSGDSTPKLITSDSVEYRKDRNRFTSPDLHRRVNPQPPTGDEVAPRRYTFKIISKHSFRLTKIFTHDEDSIVSEIP